MNTKPALIWNFLSNLLLPVAVGIYPVLFLYARNVKILTLATLGLPLWLPAVVAAAGFGLFLLFQKRLETASLSMAVFMVLYYLYGLLISRMLAWNVIPVRQYIFLPVVIVVGIYAGYFIAKIKVAVAAVIQRVLLWLSLGLVALNLVIAAPTVIQKVMPPATSLAPTTRQAASINTGKKYPDIYFVIFDDYVGFQAMRDYWHNTGVDQFQSFLAQNHFFLAPDSQSVTWNTLSEMASRMNLHQYTMDTDSTLMTNALDNNKVMSILKSYGYTTVAINMAFPNVKADKVVNFSPTDIAGMGSDEFQRTFIQGSMADAFSSLLINPNEVGVKQEQAIDYALQQTTSLPKISTPMFVYTHLLLPHEPFIFDANGNLNPPQDFYNWHYYLGQYEYTTKVAEQLITTLLAQADPNDPPVIIIQSDEGAKDNQSRTTGGVFIDGALQNFPSAYYTQVLNAMYLPGFDTSTLPANLAPIDTFEVVLNHYLNAGVSVDPNCPCTK